MTSSPVTAILIAIVILVLSLTPNPVSLPIGIDYIDKIEHAAAYLVLGISVFRALRKRESPGRGLIAFACCAGFGAALEVLQHFVGRTMDLGDFLADATGAAVGVVIGRLIEGRVNKRAVSAR